MNLTNKQILAIVIAALSYSAGAGAFFTDLFGAAIAKEIIGVLGFVNGLLSTVMVVITSQGSLVRDVQAMPGVEAITVNPRANQTLAALAVDPAQPKIDSAPGVGDEVKKIAEGVKG